MNAFEIKPYLIRLYIAAFLIFFANKFGMRHFVLDHDLPEFTKTFVLSIPNTCEAIIGMSMLTGLLLFAKFRLRPRLDRIPDLAIYLLATLVTGTYVLTQEFRLHNLGGNNVYDPYDVAASVIGLVGMLLLFIRFGVIEPAGKGA